MPALSITEAVSGAAAKGANSVVQPATLFTSLAGRLYTHQSTLASYKGKVKFNLDDDQHVELVNQCSQAVKDKLAALQSIDKKIAGALGTGFAATLLAILLPFVFGTVATVAFTCFGYQWGLRQQAYLDYTNALENLVNCCVWTLGDVNGQNQKKIQTNPAIGNMMQTLAPLTNTNQLRGFIDKQIENQVIDSIQEAATNVSLDGTKLEEEQLNLYFRTYGYQQGGFLAIMSGLWYTIKNMFARATGKEVVKDADHGKGKGAPTDAPVPVDPNATANASASATAASATAAAPAPAASAESDAPALAARM